MPTDPTRAVLYARADEPTLFEAELELHRQEDIAAGLALSMRGWIDQRFFDHGPTRHTHWRDRPRANELLHQITNPHRPFEVLVLGSVHQTLPPDGYWEILHHATSHGVTIWLPQTEGPLNVADPLHQQLVSAAVRLGHTLRSSDEGGR